MKMKGGITSQHPHFFQVLCTLQREMSRKYTDWLAYSGKFAFYPIVIAHDIV